MISGESTKVMVVVWLNFNASSSSDCFLKRGYRGGRGGRGGRGAMMIKKLKGIGFIILYR